MVYSKGIQIVREIAEAEAKRKKEGKPRVKYEIREKPKYGKWVRTKPKKAAVAKAKEPEPKPEIYTKQQMLAHLAGEKARSAMDYTKYSTKFEQQLRSIDPKAKYQVPVAFFIPGGKGYQTISGADVQKMLREEWQETSTGFREYSKSSGEQLREIRTHHPKTTYKPTDKGFEILSAGTTGTFTKEKYYGLSLGERGIAQVFAPFTSGVKGLAGLLPGLFGISGEKQETIGGRTYIRRGTSVGFIYQDPLTGKDFFKHGGKLHEYKGSYSIIADISPTVPTYLDYVIPGIPQWRKDWLGQIFKEDPTSRITLGAGEGFAFGAFAFGFGKVIGKGGKIVGGKVAKMPSVQKLAIQPTLKLGRFYYSGIQRISPKLFEPVKGASYWETLTRVGEYPARYTYHVGGKGGLVSKFMIQSPKRFGLKGFMQPHWYAAGSRVSSSFFKSWGKTDRGFGLMSGYDILKDTTLRRSLWGLPKLTETGKLVVGRGGSWRYVGSEAAKGLLTPGTSKVFGVAGKTTDSVYLSMQKMGLSQPTGMFGKEMTLTHRAMGLGYTKIDLNAILKNMNVIRVGDFLAKTPTTISSTFKGAVFDVSLGKWVRPSTGYVARELTPATYTGTTLTQLRFPVTHIVSKRVPSGFPYERLVYPPGTKTTGLGLRQLSRIGGTTLGGIGMGAARRGADFFTKFDIKPSLKHEIKTDVRFRSDFDKVLTSRLTGKLTTGGRVTGSLTLNDMMSGMETSQAQVSASASAMRLDTATMSLSAMASAMKQATAPYSVQKVRGLYPPFWWPKPASGRRRMFGDDEWWGKKYKFREFKVGLLPGFTSVNKTISNLDKQFKKSFGTLKTYKKKRRKRR